VVSIDVNNIFSVSAASFDDRCLETFRFQYRYNPVYTQWCNLTGITPALVKTPAAIPALPISFFKTHAVTSTGFTPERVFESSGTTGSVNSRHLVKEAAVYRQSFQQAFRLFYGEEKNWCILGLLPSYLERQNSSLVMMVDELIRSSGHPDGGFYLTDWGKLSFTLQKLEKQQQKTLLIGVTFGLLDFAEAHPQQLKHAVVMETGGMKGRRKELTRAEVHDLLMKGLGVTTVHSEYGMTELLSQAYSNGRGRFYCPPWMKVLIRDEEDPLAVKETGTGLLQVIDLANLYSCSFIATEDVGMVFPDGSFEVWGRLDNSDIRGCSLLVV
jgi:phenylacetate-coenzyme A ligase PaaK-like adenylate-forming protein